KSYRELTADLIIKSTMQCDALAKKPKQEIEELFIKTKSFYASQPIWSKDVLRRQLIDFYNLMLEKDNFIAENIVTIKKYYVEFLNGSPNDFVPNNKAYEAYTQQEKEKKQKIKEERDVKLRIANNILLGHDQKYPHDELFKEAELHVYLPEAASEGELEAKLNELDRSVSRRQQQ